MLDLSEPMTPETFLSSSQQQCTVFHCQDMESAEIHKVSVEHLGSHLHMHTHLMQSYF